MERLPACLNFTVELLCWYKQKVIPMSYGSSTASSWKTWRLMRLDVVLIMRDICISFNLDLIIQFSSSGRSTKFKDILPCNISQMTMKMAPVSMKINIRSAIKRGNSFWVWKKSMETDTTTWSGFPNGAKTIAGQIIKRNLKKQDQWTLQSRILIGKLPIWIRLSKKI